MTYVDGNEYEGEFVNGERQGLGVMTYATGTISRFLTNYFIRGKI
jgi:hypothetical protein